MTPTRLSFLVRLEGLQGRPQHSLQAQSLHSRELEKSYSETYTASHDSSGCSNPHPANTRHPYLIWFSKIQL